MRNFFNDGFNDDEDFINRWNEFNRMMDDSKFNESIGKVQKDLENLLRGMMNSKDFDNINNTPIKFIITPINTGDEDFDIPKDVNTYLHRIGRSGRWGRKGIGINFITRRDVAKLKEIETYYATQITEMPSDTSFLSSL